MSKKNKREMKKQRRAAKAFTPPVPSYIDLVDYVKFRTRCSRKTAVKVVLYGALSVNSKPVGFKWERDQKVLDPFLPAHLQSKIVVQMPEDLRDA